MGEMGSKADCFARCDSCGTTFTASLQENDTIHATINGSITAAEIVPIREDTRIDGDVRGSTVEIAESATVTGEIQERS